MIPHSQLYSDGEVQNTDVTFDYFVWLQAAMTSLNDIHEYLTFV